MLVVLPSADPAWFLSTEAVLWARIAVIPYIGLPPGWRFLSAPGYEDV